MKCRDGRTDGPRMRIERSDGIDRDIEMLTYLKILLFSGFWTTAKNVTDAFARAKLMPIEVKIGETKVFVHFPADDTAKQYHPVIVRVKLPYDPVCPSFGWLVDQFLLPCFYRSTCYQQ